MFQTWGPLKFFYLFPSGNQKFTRGTILLVYGQIIKNSSPIDLWIIMKFHHLLFSGIKIYSIQFDNWRVGEKCITKIYFLKFGGSYLIIEKKKSWEVYSINFLISWYFWMVNIIGTINYLEINIFFNIQLFIFIIKSIQILLSGCKKKIHCVLAGQNFLWRTLYKIPQQKKN